MHKGRLTKDAAMPGLELDPATDGGSSVTDQLTPEQLRIVEFGDVPLVVIVGAVPIVRVAATHSLDPRSLASCGSSNKAARGG